LVKPATARNLLVLLEDGFYDRKIVRLWAYVVVKKRYDFKVRVAIQRRQEVKTHVLLVRCSGVSVKVI
jgi:hypothetical protein